MIPNARRGEGQAADAAPTRSRTAAKIGMQEPGVGYLSVLALRFIFTTLCCMDALCWLVIIKKEGFTGLDGTRHLTGKKLTARYPFGSCREAQQAREGALKDDSVVEAYVEPEYYVLNDYCIPASR
jgi:hypothetical protein